MTTEVALVLAIILVAVILFVSDRLRVDLIALMVLGTLVLTGLITPVEAFAGFSNAAVVTVWAVFILSGALTETGVANLIGKQVLRLAGRGELRLMLIIMATAAILSAFMNNVGVAALLLPVVMELSKRTGHSSSRLLLPLAYGALLGGLTTLIGTPPNILVSDALRQNGLAPFTLFDFAPVGVSIAAAGILFTVLFGRHLLPARRVQSNYQERNGDLETLYRLQERMLLLRIPADSALTGSTLENSRIGAILGLNVIAILQGREALLSPSPDTRLQGGDRLLVVGDTTEFDELRHHQVDTLARMPLTQDRLEAAGLESAEVVLESDAPIVDSTLAASRFRGDSGLNVLAVRREGRLLSREILALPLKVEDTLIVAGNPKQIEEIGSTKGYRVLAPDESAIVMLNERLLLVRIPKLSGLVHKTLAETRLGATFDLTVVRIVRDDSVILLPSATEQLRPDDLLLIHGESEQLEALRGLEQMELEEVETGLLDLESAQIGVAEAMLSPHSTLADKSLRDLHFRDKYGLNVLAIWRGGRAYRRDIADMPLRFGDALLVYGQRRNLRLLASEPDFLVLTESLQAPPRFEKAPVAVGVMIAVLLSVLFGWLPIAVAAVVGATLMVLTRCLSMEEAYRYIEWSAVFLIAAMLPLGTAMANSGTADFLANSMMAAVGSAGAMVVLAGLFIMTILASQVMPNAAVVVLMAPIALNTAADLGVSPYTFLMGIAIAASASFLSPVSHPANVLVMGPGGYRFSDYIKVGLPLTIIVLLVSMLLLPIVWPL
ncbi:MAG: SLC13 family permease [Candidatus Promineifilaceae bacterium]|nr:SLC13 family permease [Candidatus Promineifilaceae bacterium]